MNKLLKGGIIATLPILMMIAITPTVIPEAHANGCVSTADGALGALVPGEINQRTADGILKKLEQAESKVLLKPTDAEQKIQDAKNKVQQLFDRNKITEDTKNTLNTIVDDFETCLGL